MIPPFSSLLKWAALVLLLAGIVFGQKPGKAKPKRNTQDDIEAQWMCKIGSFHDCRCPAMMAELQEEGVKHCADTSPTHKDYVACLSKLPSNCEIIQKPDQKHPEHTCKRSCRKARCQCDDGPPCVGPSLTEHYRDDSSDEVQQQ